MKIDKSASPKRRPIELIAGIPIAIVCGIIWGFVANSMQRQLPFVVPVIALIIGFLSVKLSGETGIRSAVKGLALVLLAVVVSKGFLLKLSQSRDVARATEKMTTESEAIEYLGYKMIAERSLSPEVQALADESPDTLMAEVIIEASERYDLMSATDRQAILDEMDGVGDHATSYPIRFESAFSIDDFASIPLALVIAFVLGMGGKLRARP